MFKPSHHIYPYDLLKIHFRMGVPFLILPAFEDEENSFLK